MVDFGTVLASLLGMCLGFFFILYPQAVIRTYTLGRFPHDTKGKYGTESPVSKRWKYAVQAVGFITLLVGLYLGITLLI